MLGGFLPLSPLILGWHGLHLACIDLFELDFVIVDVWYSEARFVQFNLLSLLNHCLAIVGSKSVLYQIPKYNFSNQKIPVRFCIQNVLGYGGFN